MIYSYSLVSFPFSFDLSFSPTLACILDIYKFFLLYLTTMHSLLLLLGSDLLFYCTIDFSKAPPPWLFTPKHLFLHSLTLFPSLPFFLSYITRCPINRGIPLVGK